MGSLIPIYYQIKHSVKAWIVNKEFSPGQKIPSENQLADRFQVNRMTVRQAISQLIQEGFLVSRRGEGTFVTNDENRISKFGLEFTGFMDDLFYQVSRSKTKSVEVNIIKSSKYVADRLKLAEIGQELFQIKRLRILKNRPFGFTINYLPMDVGNKIRKEELYKKPLLQILEKDLGFQLTEALQTVEATFAAQDVAKYLGIMEGSPILFVERVMYSTNMRPIELVQSSHPGDLYKYIIRLKNVKGKSGNSWVHQEK
jgi:GntR family transcriptional regulator